MTKLQFRFNYLQNTLAIHQEGNIWHQIPAENQFTAQFGSSGFRLNSGWMSFTTYQNKIQVFYKQIKTLTWISYYRKDLPKECPVIFSFKAADQIEKINGKWVKKGGQYE